MHIRSFRYTPEMVDCRYCTEHARMPPHCKLPRCPWIAERIEAGVVGYREAVSFYHRYNPKLRERLNSLVICFPNSLWLNQAHQERMEHLKAVLRYSKKRNTPEWYAVLFLVSTSEDLYRRTINCFTKTSIDFSRASLRGISVSDYTLLMAAKTIYTGEERLTLAELEDREIVDDDTFRLVINAQLIARYGLPVSVIENPEGKKKSHALYVAEKNGQPSFPKLIRADIDNAILATNTRAAFFDYLEDMGYQLRLYKKNGDWREQPSLRPPGAQKFFRFNTLGADYSLEELELRSRRKITKGEPFPEADREIVRQHRVKSQPPYRKHETGLSGLYVRYRFELGIIYKYPASVKRVSQFLREDIVKMEKLDAETMLLGKAQITTMEDLLRYKSELQSKLDAAEQQRKDLRNLERSYARKHDPENAEQCSAEVAELTKEIKKLRKNIDLCDDIALRSAQTREELEWIIEQQEQSREAESDVQRDEKADRQR